MKKSVVFSILPGITLFLSMTGCMQKDCGCDPEPGHNQAVLFQYEYQNHAWGFRHKGFLIDEKGTVKGYFQPKNWIFPDSSGVLAGQDLENNLSQCDTICGTVDQRILNQYFGNIESIRFGKIVDNGVDMADAGTGRFSAWYRNERTGKYESVFLSSSGDVNRVNSHPDVKELVDWLIKIGERSNRFSWFVNMPYHPVLFQYEYYNYAWGFRHLGFMIDQKGNVNGFKQPKNWTVPDSMGMMSKAGLENNLAQCDTVCGTVDKFLLDENYKKIPDIRNGKIIDNGLVMADAGTGELSAWFWNERAEKYENVFLISNGDVYKVNSHPDVKELVDWLRKIGEKTDRFFWFGN